MGRGPGGLSRLADPGLPQLTPPILGEFLRNNQGSAVFTDHGRGVSIRMPAGSGENWRMLMKPIPPAPWIITLGLRGAFSLNSFHIAGLLMWDSVGGKMMSLETIHFATGTEMRMAEWTNPTLYSTNGVTNQAVPPTPRFLQLEDDGTNWIGRFSNDGYHFGFYGQVARNTFVTPTHYGFGVDCNTNSRELVVNFDHWGAALAAPLR